MGERQAVPSKVWFTADELAAVRLPDMPGTARNITALAVAEGWRADPAKARRAQGRGGGWEYHLSALPPGAQIRLIGARPSDAAPAPTADASVARWARYEKLPAPHKQECARRLDALDQVARLQTAGMTLTLAIEQVAASTGAGARSIHRWRIAVTGLPRNEWLPALASNYTATSSFADCHERAWNVLVSDYLRPEKPTFSACVRRMRKVASANGWLPIPSERALRRRLETETPAAVITLAREGAKKAKTLYPAQSRTRATLHAMEAVNMDGHELDVFVATEDGRTVRMHLLALQDLYSGMIVAWRLSETENKETVRLVIGDMVERHGIPDKIVLDNGRAFTSKWISGQTPNRFRFKIRDEDPKGVLVALGVEIVWAKPYSGQSKPIERAFRDLADNIAKHPACAGAYTGNRPENKPANYGTRTVPLAVFAELVAEQIADHNERAGRRAENCAGRSFRETFEASLAAPTTIVRFASPAQRALWLLTAETVRTQKASGEIAFMENRYWNAALNEHAGRKVVVRFDPANLHQSVRVYDLADSFICEAECIARTGYFDQAAARVHERNRAAFQKAIRTSEELRERMSADELARLMNDQRPAPAPEPAQPKIKRLAVGGARPQPMPEPMSESEFEASFSRGLRLVSSND